LSVIIVNNRALEQIGTGGEINNGRCGSGRAAFPRSTSIPVAYGSIDGCSVVVDSIT
jgi:hypothetical protein